jgi:hypothetical protein
MTSRSPAETSPQWVPARQGPVGRGREREDCRGGRPREYPDPEEHPPRQPPSSQSSGGSTNKCPFSRRWRPSTKSSIAFRALPARTGVRQMTGSSLALGRSRGNTLATVMSVLGVLLVLGTTGWSYHLCHATYKCPANGCGDWPKQSCDASIAALPWTFGAGALLAGVAISVRLRSRRRLVPRAHHDLGP